MADPLAAIQHLHHIRADHVAVGQKVRRYSHDWIIQGCLPIFCEDGVILIGYDPVTHQRTALRYDSPSDAAEVIQ